MADLVSDADQESMDAMVGVANDQLGKDDCPLGVHSTVGDPVFLQKGVNSKGAD